KPTDLTKFSVIVPFMDVSFTASGGFKRDNLVIPPYADKLWYNYWYWDEGFVQWKEDLFLIQAGVKQHSIGPGNIYKLFVDEKGFSYPSYFFRNYGKLRVEILWGGLRLLENDSKPVKGFNYRSIIYSPMHGLEIAYEESILYLNRFFDPYYFFIPIPVPAIQEFWHLNAPWGYPTSKLDDNSMIGAWVRYTGDSYSLYSEILIDDINMNRFLRPESFQNPDKIAFLFGFSGKSGPYKLTFEVAGASAFTFQRISSNKPYEYVYFENSNFPIEKNMIGYKHGENNIACSIALEYSNNNWLISATYEGLIYGTRTPDKPWHGGTTPSGTHWLVGDVKSRYSFSARVAYTFKNLIQELGELTTGLRFGFSGDKIFIGLDLSTTFLINQ
ncbi:MAG: hypothetical protein ACK40Q_06600, partial [Pseudothermotoga sp.]